MTPSRELHYPIVASVRLPHLCNINLLTKPPILIEAHCLLYSIKLEAVWGGGGNKIPGLLQDLLRSFGFHPCHLELGCCPRCSVTEGRSYSVPCGLLGTGSPPEQKKKVGVSLGYFHFLF